MEVLETVTEMADKLSPSEQLRLFEHLGKRLQKHSVETRKPKDLYGSWRGKFPEDFDVDAALHEIRSEWLKELDEL